MIFKARIYYTETQKAEAQRFVDLNCIFCEVLFTFQDLVGRQSFVTRELLVPWLEDGNIPEIIEE